MYDISYLLLFYIIGLIGFLVIIISLFLCGFFHKTQEISKPKTTIDFLIEQVKNADGNKAVLDSVMKEFYSHFYNMSQGSQYFYKWIDLIHAITMLDYMSVEQTAKFRDDLVNKNPSIKKEIEHSIGESLKYRENKEKKR